MNIDYRLEDDDSNDDIAEYEVQGNEEYHDAGSDTDESPVFRRCQPAPIDHVIAASDGPAKKQSAHHTLQHILNDLNLYGRHPIMFSSERVSDMLQLVDVNIRYCMQRKCTLVALFARSAQGNSACVFMEGWYAHMVIKAPAGWKDDARNRESIGRLLDEKIASRVHETEKQEMFKKMRIGRFIHSIETKRGESIMGYVPDGVSDFLLIRCAAPSVIESLRDCFHGYSRGTQSVPGVHLVMPPHSEPRLSNGSTETFESDVEAKMQFMSDMAASGFQWFRISGVQRHPTRTTCDYEIDATVADIAFEDCYAHADIAPLRLLSFDIEAAAGERGVFPNAQKDPCIQISIICKVHHSQVSTPIPSILLSLGDCDPIEGCFVLSFDDEAVMLRAFADIVSKFNADCILAYNQNNFDFPYIQTRAVQLGVDAYFDSVMSRLLKHKMRVVVSVFESAQTGPQQRNKIEIPGRCSVDLYVYIRGTFKLDKYSLNFVCDHFIGHGKDDIYFGDITSMWHAGSEQRCVLGRYCIKDAHLVLLLDAKLSIMVNIVEACRIYGLTASIVLSRGATVRCDRQFFGQCREPSDDGSCFFVPYKRSSVKGSYQGATVMDPVTGISEDVGTLDFKSMYPNIIVSSNMCATTRIILPDGTIIFVEPDVRESLLRKILKKLMSAREHAKQASEAETDPAKKEILNARQQQLKISCNSIYGWLAAEHAIIHLPSFAEMVTAQGRRDIETVKQIALTTFVPQKGYPGAGVQVICGDTDSIFVSFTNVIAPEVQGQARIEEAFRLSHILADAVNAVMPAPKKIEVEKVWTVLIVTARKRYFGFLMSSPTSKPKFDIKGMDCVRRNGCALIRENVRTVIEILATQRDVGIGIAAIREIVRNVIEDTVPIEQYVMRQVLRKSKPDCSKPMPPKQLLAIRNQLGSDSSASTSTQQLSYSEIDAAIRKKIKLHFETTSLMPHVEVAWRMRLEDPGTAPVPGKMHALTRFRTLA